MLSGDTPLRKSPLCALQCTLSVCVKRSTNRHFFCFFVLFCFSTKPPPTPTTSPVLALHCKGTVIVYIRCTATEMNFVDAPVLNYSISNSRQQHRAHKQCTLHLISGVKGRITDLPGICICFDSVPWNLRILAKSGRRGNDVRGPLTSSKRNQITRKGLSFHLKFLRRCCLIAGVLANMLRLIFNVSQCQWLMHTFVTTEEETAQGKQPC